MTRIKVICKINDSMGFTGWKMYLYKGQHITALRAKDVPGRYKFLHGRR